MGPKITVRATAAPHFAFSFLTFSSAQSHPRISDQEVFQSQVQFAALTHHAGLLCVRDGAYSLRAGLGDCHITNFKVLVKDQSYGIIICRSL
jgi:hypothetical protein